MSKKDETEPVLGTGAAGDPKNPAGPRAGTQPDSTAKPGESKADKKVAK